MSKVNTDSEYVDSLKKAIARLSPEQKNTLADMLNLQMNSEDTKLVASIVTLNNKLVSSEELTKFASESLAQHSVPQLWRHVKALPRTDAGKIQRKQLAQYVWEEVAEDKNAEENENEDFLAMFDDAKYMPPRNNTETVLAGIWAEVLGVDQVSVDDDFLEVGGDSLLSIRILARINKAGLTIATEDFFQYPTIAGQAAAIIQASQSDSNSAFEIGNTSGSFPLTPIQYWFIDNVQHDLHHWNQAAVLEIDENRRFSNLQRAVTTVHKVHDALRIRFDELQINTAEDSNCQQHYVPLRNGLAVDYVDLSDLDDLSIKLQIHKYCDNAHQSFELKKGNLSRFILFNTKSGQSNLLVVIVHHLIIDAESWRILLEDLESSWQQYESSTRAVLADKTSSFCLWSEKLREYADSSQARSQIAYWQKQTSESRLPLDLMDTSEVDKIALKSEDSLVLSSTVPSDLSGQQLEGLAKKLNLTIRDLLIFTLLESLYDWGDLDEILLDIESHGREALFKEVDVSRTVGWFTTVFPCLFTRNRESETLDSLYSVKDTLNTIPNNGIAHGILKYLSSSSEVEKSLRASCAKSQVCFNFLGRVENSHHQRFNLGLERSPNGNKAYILEVNAKLLDDRFVIDWSYNKSLHRAESIEALAANFVVSLRKLSAASATSDNTLAYSYQSRTEPGSAENAAQEFMDDEDDMFDLDNFDEASLDALSNALSAKSAKESPNESSGSRQVKTTHIANKKKYE